MAHFAVLAAIVQRNLDENAALLQDMKTLTDDEDTMTTTAHPMNDLSDVPAINPRTSIRDLSGADVGVWVEFVHDGTDVAGVLTGVNASRWKIDSETSITVSLKTPQGWSWSSQVKGDVVALLRYDIDPKTGMIS